MARGVAGGLRGLPPSAWVAGLGLLLLAGVYWPGLATIDTASQLRQGRTGELIDNHPPALSVAWALLDAVWPGTGPLLLAQLGALTTGLALVAARARTRPRAAAAVVAALLLLPPLRSWHAVVTKDVVFAAALTLAVGLGVHAERRRSWRLVAAAGVALLAAVLVRHNGVVALPPLGGWLALVAREALGRGARGRRAVAGTALAGAALSALLGAAAIQAVDRALEPRRIHLHQAILLYDLVGIAARTGELHLPRHLLDDPTRASVAELVSAYGPASCMPLLSPLDRPRLRLTPDPERVADTAHAWRAAVASRPRAWVDHRVAVYRHLLGLYAGPNRTEVPLVTASAVDPGGPQGFRPGPSARALFALDRALVDGPLFRPWPWLLLAAGLLATAWRRADPAALATLASALLYATHWVVIAPAADLRYVLWSIQAAALGALLLLAPRPGPRPPVSASL